MSSTSTPEITPSASSASTPPPSTNPATCHPNATKSSKSKELIPYHTIQPTEANVAKFTSIIASAFHSTPLTTVFIWEIDSLAAGASSSSSSSCLTSTQFPTSPPTSSSPSKAPTHGSLTHSRRVQHFMPGIQAAATSGAILAEAGDWSAIALWEPSDFTGAPFVEARSAPGPIFQEWRTAVRRIKAQHLGVAGRAADRDEHVPLRPFWHLSFLARNPAPGSRGADGEVLHNPYAVENVAGAISAVIVPFLERAKREGVPAWLEATYPHAVAVYQGFGFRVVEEVTIGKGTCDGRGVPVEGGNGEGVKAWVMIFDGHLTP